MLGRLRCEIISNENHNKTDNSSASFIALSKLFGSTFFGMDDIIKKINDFYINSSQVIKYIFTEFPLDAQNTINQLVKCEWTLNRDGNMINFTNLMRINNEEISSEDKKHKIDLYMDNLITDEKVLIILDEIMSSKSINSERKLIVEEILFAYNNKKFFSANCLIITLVEGVIVTADKKIKWVTQNNIKDSIKNRMDYYCEVLTFKILEKGYYAIFNLDTGTKGTISRHAILHGYDVEYGKLIVYKKLLLLLSDIIKVIDTSN